MNRRGIGISAQAQAQQAQGAAAGAASVVDQHLQHRLPFPRRLHRLAVWLVGVGAVWLLVVWREHAAVVSSGSSSSTGNAQSAPGRRPPPPADVVDVVEKDDEKAPDRDSNDKRREDNNNNNNNKEAVDGTFNTLPLRWVSNADHHLRSYVDCVRHHRDQEEGDDDDKSKRWMSTSCRFTNLCMDTATKEYVLISDGDDGDRGDVDDDEELESAQLHHAERQGLALGGINPRWDMARGFDKGSSKVRWFPKVVNGASEEEVIKGYYALPSDTVWIPFHSMGGHNVGHLLWDDFYPVFRLAQLFGYVSDDENDNDDNRKYRWLLTRHVANGTLYASCDIRRNKRIQCTNNFVKFLELLGVDPFTFSSNRRIQFQPANGADNHQQQQASAAPTLVCARTGLAGIGMLTDHGLRDHGWETRRSWTPHNYLNGRTFYDFRAFVLGNIRSQYKLRIPPPLGGSTSVLLPDGNSQHQQQQQLRITFSVLSSRDFDRRLDFARQISALSEAVYNGDGAAKAAGAAGENVSIRSYALWNMTVAEQLQVALDTHIWISACGGASMTSTFLPRGSSLILFFNETGGLNFANMTSNSKPARLDWDLLNNSHLRVHWLPIGTMNTPQALRVFVRLIQHELALMRN